jgi:hypothetical protein
MSKPLVKTQAISFFVIYVISPLTSVKIPLHPNIGNINSHLYEKIPLDGVVGGGLWSLAEKHKGGSHADSHVNRGACRLGTGTSQPVNQDRITAGGILAADRHEGRAAAQTAGRRTQGEEKGIACKLDSELAGNPQTAKSLRVLSAPVGRRFEPNHRIQAMDHISTLGVCHE